MKPTKTDTKRIEIRPHARQELFLSSPADIALFGGAAGGGKTRALEMEPLRHIGNPLFRCVIFRRTFTQVTLAGGLWDESMQLYSQIPGANPSKGNLMWTFKSGATVTFGHLQHADTVFDWQGSQITLLCFDELTHFTEEMFFYMLSRNRSVSGIRPYVRATFNADSESWVAKFIEWWIDPETGFPIEERSGVLRYFIRYDNQFIWGDTPEELAEYCKERNLDLLPKSVTFIPATVYDNPTLLQQDPAYVSNLMALSYVEKERLLKGNWKVRAAAGKIFNRDWYDIVEPADVPAGGLWVLCWDFAATEKKIGKVKSRNNDPDFTAAIAMKYYEGTYYITGCWAEQLSPAASEKWFQTLSMAFAEMARLQSSINFVRFEVEGGSAGKRDALNLIKLLPSVDVRGFTPQGDKLMRAKPFAAQSHVRNVKLVKGKWNDMWLAHMHNQPDLPHDDIMDATSGAYNAINTFIAETGILGMSGNVGLLPSISYETM